MAPLPNDDSPQSNRPFVLRKRAILAGKWAVTLILFAWIIRGIDWAAMRESIVNSNLMLLALAVLICFFGMILSAYKWKCLLGIHGIQYSFAKLLRWYFIALFLNKVLPTTIGGDGYRIYKTIGNPRSRACAVLAIFVERATGFGALIAIGYLSACWLFFQSSDQFLGAVAVVGVWVAVVVLVGIFMVYKLGLIGKLLNARWCPKPVRSLLYYLGDFRQQPTQSIIVVLLSIVFQFSSISISWLLLAAVGIQIDFFTVASVWSAVELVGLLPVSVGGLGLMDAAFVRFMAYFGVDNVSAFAGMLLRRAAVLPTVVVGAICYLRRENQDRVAENSQQKTDAAIL